SFVFDSTTWLVIVRQLPEEAASESQNRINYCHACLPVRSFRRRWKPSQDLRLAIGYQPSTLSYRPAARSASYSLMTSIYLSSTRPVKRSIATCNPVMLLPFHDEGVLKTRSI